MNLKVKINYCNMPYFVQFLFHSERSTYKFKLCQHKHSFNWATA